MGAGKEIAASKYIINRLQNCIAAYKVPVWKIMSQSAAQLACIAKKVLSHSAA
jgi:hypothetical protein